MPARLRDRTTAVRLFGLACLTLYLELAMIRFASAEVLYLGYFSNYVLIAVFLGIGLGFLTAGRRVNLFRWLPPLLVAIVAFILLTRLDVTPLLGGDSQLYFSVEVPPGVLPIWVCLPVLFAGIVLLFACIAQETARCFPAFTPIVAYSIDIAGSAAGIVAFTVCSALGTPPTVWFVVTFIVVAALSWGTSARLAVACGIALVLLLAHDGTPHFARWSPYQKVEVKPNPWGIFLTVNGIGHQTIHSFVGAQNEYDFAYGEVRERLGGRPYRRALILGAGSGNDVAYALHYGVGHIDAVEIDPAIVAAGRRFHPDKPYDSERVSVYVTDGRAFMEHATQRYDLIIYALPDSLALLSTFSSIRLESFLFTVESFVQARRLLTDDGVLVLYNYYRQRWLLEKLAAMLTVAFGHPPLVHVFGNEQRGLLSALAIGPTLAGPPLAAPFGPEDLARDDWPFLYMRGRHLPALYVWIMLLFVGSAVLGVVIVGPRSFAQLPRNGPFLLMGAAFLLLETKSVIQFALLFGATWLVNALVFFAILLSVLAANWLVAALDVRRPGWLFVVLFGALLLNLTVPLPALLQIESPPLRYLIASLVSFSPIFAANLVFGSLFKDTATAGAAFGWNVIGAMLGGALEYTSLVLGYQHLMVVVTGLYGLCALWTYALVRQAR